MLTFEYPHFYQNDKPWIPEIFDAGHGEVVPDGFNAVRIPLDGEIYSDLKWDASLQHAQKLAEQGYKLLWDLNLGLFSRLRYSLSDIVQFQTLALAVHHLVSLIKRDFIASTLGIVLYRGSLDFSMGVAQRAMCMQVLQQLRMGWPDAIQPILLLDAARVRSPLQQLILTQRDRMSPFLLAISGSRLPGATLGWDWGSPYGYLSRKRLPLETIPDAKIGFCLPTADLTSSDEPLLEQTLYSLIAAKTPFRVITEEFLTVDWDGLDQILVPPSGLSSDGMRKLQGFCAAGGIVNRIAFSQEMSAVSFTKLATESSGM